MADKKISELAELTTPLANDLFAIVDVAGNETKKVKYSTLFSKFFPSGLILMWKGSIASIPTGWALCDGNNDTPDLRDRFIVGAKQDDAGVAKTNVTGVLTQVGGAIEHSHIDDGHNHFAELIAELNQTGIYDAGHTHNISVGTGVKSDMDLNNYTDEGEANLIDDGHTHSVAGYTYEGHAEIEISSNLPPYYALAFIMKI